MIKVKLSADKDMKCFSGLIHTRDLLRDYSIDITNSDDYDYEFIDHGKFIKNSAPLQESIDWGLEELSKKSGDYFLFHGGDSTSIMGAYEVFIESDAKYLFKKQLLSQEDYKEKTTINKWFFGKGSILDKGYDIPDEVYNRIKLTGYNVAHNWPHLQHMQDGNLRRDIDLCAVYNAILSNGNMDHELQTDILYTKHRKGSWDVLREIDQSYNIVARTLTPPEFANCMRNSKIGLSPFGMGELCYRDLEFIQYGCLLIKPDMNKVITEPDFFKPMETYVPVKPDWSDLNETIKKVLANFKDYQYIIDNARQKVTELYSYQNVCMYWYNFFANQSGVESE
tara:strand:- start:703 stop:1716 length:1014 start_codon:yes stop_codon:yes gene_type:complete